MPRSHYFDTDIPDRAAYDRTQTDDSIRDGDVLVFRKSVGIQIQAWPTIVRGLPGEFHSLLEGSSWGDVDRGRYVLTVADIHMGEYYWPA